jgi:hypothetical protein
MGKLNKSVELHVADIVNDFVFLMVREVLRELVGGFNDV